jgi:hypothetical protein
MTRNCAVVFDFGGVLITPITDRMVAMAAERNTTLPTLLEVLLGPHASGDHPWHRAERGELAVADIQQQLEPWADALGVRLTGDEIDTLLEPRYKMVQPMIDRIASLRAEGYITGLLTNTFAEFRPTLERDLDLGLFDVVIESYAVQARKPEPAIYQATIDALGIDALGIAPGDIVYLDDFPQNIVGAQQAGWRTIHVTDIARALADLDAVLASRS